MQKPLFAFFGTPDFATKALDALEYHALTPALVVTAPDKSRGRTHGPSPTPVKEWALERNITVETPLTLKDGELLAELKNTDWDFFLVAAYAKLIPQSILDIPRYGSLNIHPSLLPKFRGPSPVLSAILADERLTGVSIMKMTEKMDAGPIVAQARIEIDEEAWPIGAQMLSEMLFTEGGNLLAEILPDWIAGKIEPEPQDESAATYTKKFSDEDARVEIEKIDDPQYARKALVQIHAFDKNPRAYFLAKRKKGEPMRVIIVSAHKKGSTLVIDRVIPEGKKEMNYQDYLRGR